MPVTSHAKIFTRYVQGDFIHNAIPTFPITFLLAMSNSQQFKILYLIKVIRIFEGLKYYNVEFVMAFLKVRNTKKVKRNIENDPLLENNLDLDQNKINLFFKIRYGLKVFKLFLMIINISYFTGIIWMIFCQNVQRELKKMDVIEPEENFFDYFGIEESSESRQVLISLYYSFTSLSTVGFGDFHPRSNVERLFCSVVLVGGVIVFSYIMGDFIAMLENYQILNGEIDDGDNLSMFFGMMKKYNKNVPIKQDLKLRIE
jgi:hypothetical protein